MNDSRKRLLRRAKSVLKWMLAITVLLFAAGSWVYFFHPEWIAQLVINSDRANAGLRAEAIQVGDWELPYLVGGEGHEQTVVLIHGFTSNKDSFIGLARKLSESYRVIAPDMPGHGDTEVRMDETYDNDLFVSTLEEFLDAMSIEKCHLIGESLGGAHSAMVASRNPDLVTSLILFAPPGLHGDTLSAFDKMADQGKHPAIFDDREGMERGIEMVLNEVPELPDIAWRYLFKQGISRKPLNSKMLAELLESADEAELSSQAAAIESPTLIFWGEADQICHVSASRVWQECNARFRIGFLPDAGHALLFKNLDSVFDTITEHLQQPHASIKRTSPD